MRSSRLNLIRKTAVATEIALPPEVTDIATSAELTGVPVAMATLVTPVMATFVPEDMIVSSAPLVEEIAQLNSHNITDEQKENILLKISAIAMTQLTDEHISSLFNVLRTVLNNKGNSSSNRANVCVTMYDLITILQEKGGALTNEQRTNLINDMLNILTTLPEHINLNLRHNASVLIDELATSEPLITDPQLLNNLTNRLLAVLMQETENSEIRYNASVTFLTISPQLTELEKEGVVNCLLVALTENAVDSHTYNRERNICNHLVSLITSSEPIEIPRLNNFIDALFVVINSNASSVEGVLKQSAIDGIKKLAIHQPIAVVNKLIELLEQNQNNNNKTLLICEMIYELIKLHEIIGFVEFTGSQQVELTINGLFRLLGNYGDSNDAHARSNYPDLFNLIANLINIKLAELAATDVARLKRWISYLTEEEWGRTSHCERALVRWTAGVPTVTKLATVQRVQVINILLNCLEELDGNHYVLSALCIILQDKTEVNHFGIKQLEKLVNLIHTAISKDNCENELRQAGIKAITQMAASQQTEVINRLLVLVEREKKFQEIDWARYPSGPLPAQIQNAAPCPLKDRYIEKWERKNKTVLEIKKLKETLITALCSILQDHNNFDHFERIQLEKIVNVIVTEISESNCENDLRQTGVKAIAHVERFQRTEVELINEFLQICKREEADLVYRFGDRKKQLPVKVTLIIDVLNVILQDQVAINSFGVVNFFDTIQLSEMIESLMKCISFAYNRQAFCKPPFIDSSAIISLITKLAIFQPSEVIGYLTNMIVQRGNYERNARKVLSQLIKSAEITAPEKLNQTIDCLLTVLIDQSSSCQSEDDERFAKSTIYAEKIVFCNAVIKLIGSIQPIDVPQLNKRVNVLVAAMHRSRGFPHAIKLTKACNQALMQLMALQPIEVVDSLLDIVKDSDNNVFRKLVAFTLLCNTSKTNPRQLAQLVDVMPSLFMECNNQQPERLTSDNLAPAEYFYASTLHLCLSLTAVDLLQAVKLSYIVATVEERWQAEGEGMAGAIMHLARLQPIGVANSLLDILKNKSQSMLIRTHASDLLYNLIKEVQLTDPQIDELLSHLQGLLLDNSDNPFKKSNGNFCKSVIKLVTLVQVTDDARLKLMISSLLTVMDKSTEVDNKENASAFIDQLANLQANNVLKCLLGILIEKTNSSSSKRCAYLAIQKLAPANDVLALMQSEEILNYENLNKLLQEMLVVVMDSSDSPLSRRYACTVIRQIPEEQISYQIINKLTDSLFRLLQELNETADNAENPLHPYVSKMRDDACAVIGKLAALENVQIADDVFLSFAITSMLHALKDRCPSVKNHARIAMARLAEAALRIAPQDQSLSVNLTRVLPARSLSSVELHRQTNLENFSIFATTAADPDEVLFSELDETDSDKLLSSTVYFDYYKN